MKQPRKSFKKRVGNRAFTVYPWTHAATGKQKWRFAYKPTPDGDWKYVTRSTKEEAEAEAERILTDQCWRAAVALPISSTATIPSARSQGDPFWVRERSEGAEFHFLVQGTE